MAGTACIDLRGSYEFDSLIMAKLVDERSQQTDKVIALVERICRFRQNSHGSTDRGLNLA